MRDRIRIATRGSKLALWQAEHIAGRLREQYPQLDVELKKIKTSGDKIQDVPLAKVGGKGLFVKEIEEALERDEADLAVHSMKDVPAELPPGLVLGVIPQRDDPSDCFLSKAYSGLDSLPQGGVVGTSSLRRQAQILALRPDLRLVPLRGNLDTRLRKLEQGQFDAIIVASVGLKRLELGAEFEERLEPPRFLPAIGQGTLGLEYRDSDADLQAMLQFLDHPESSCTVTAERSYLHRLEGGCQVPIGGFASLQADGSLWLQGFVSDVEGREVVRDQEQGRPQEAAAVGRRLAKRILDRGGGRILARVYSG